MPTNLPPEAQEAERRYRAAETVEEKITNLEEFLSLIPKHKGTDHLRADLRRKLSKLKSSAQQRKGSSRQVSAYHIDQEGVGQIVLVGPTNVGKSALIVASTNATPEVSAAPFTTWAPTPGMMLFENVQIQLIDTPPLNRDYVDPEMLNLIRRVDLMLLVVDVQTDPVHQLEETLSILEENRIVPLHLAERYDDDPRRLTYVPMLVLANKCDDETCDEDFYIFCELLEGEWPLIPVSAATGRNLDRMGQAVFDELDLIRIYSKIPGQDPNFEAPFVMERGGTVGEFARKVHQDFYHHLKSARVWGTGVHDGQQVGRDHVLSEGDVVELRI